MTSEHILCTQNLSDDPFRQPQNSAQLGNCRLVVEIDVLYDGTFLRLCESRYLLALKSFLCQCFDDFCQFLFIALKIYFISNILN